MALFRKGCLAPVRFAVGWTPCRSLLGLGGIASLVILRVVLGWPFFVDGYQRYRSGKGDVTPVFQNANGPLADLFRSVVWDADGGIRLDLEETKTVFGHFRDEVLQRSSLTPDQRNQVDAAFTTSVSQVQRVLIMNADRIDPFQRQRSYLAALSRETAYDHVDSLNHQRRFLRDQSDRLGEPVLRKIDRVWSRYEQTVHELAGTSQKNRIDRWRIGSLKPRTGILDTNRLNRMAPYFGMGVGLCLVLGLFTPLAALLAAVFWIGLSLSQPPGLFAPTDTYFYLVMGMASLVVAATGAGRFAGLDFLMHCMVRRFWPVGEKT